MKINDILQRDIETKNQKMWFSFLLAEIEKVDYGNVSFNFTVKQGQVVNVKLISEKSLPIHN